MVLYEDKTAVYSAIAEVQQQGLLYSVQPINMMMSDTGKVSFSLLSISSPNRCLTTEHQVRLQNLAAIEKHDNLEVLQKLAETRHWRALETMFAQLEVVRAPLVQHI